MGVFTKEEVRKIIQTEYVRESTFDRYIGTRVSFKEVEKIGASKYKNKNQTHNMIIYKSRMGIIFLAISAFLFLIGHFIFSDKKTTPATGVKIMYWILFFAILVGSYIILFVPKKVFIRINTDSFILKDELEIFWNEILITGILTVHKKHSSHVLLLGLDSGDIIKIDMEESEMSNNDFLRIIHLNQA